MSEGEIVVSNLLRRENHPRRNLKNPDKSNYS
jgi:hypothetical protein